MLCRILLCLDIDHMEVGIWNLSEKILGCIQAIICILEISIWLLSLVRHTTTYLKQHTYHTTQQQNVIE